MKTKLTLTVRKNVIDRAKRYSRKQKKSISRLFEDLFENAEAVGIKTEPQRAAERLLQKLDTSKPVKTLNDETFLKAHVARKYS